MRKVRICIGMLLIATGFASAELAFENATISAVIPPDVSNYTFTFPFKNASTVSVEITGVKNSCGCTAAKPDKLTYLPGEEGTIEGSFSVGKRIGNQKVSVTVASTNSVSGINSKKLSLNLEIPQLLESTPSMLLWRMGSEPTEKAITVKLSDKFDVKVNAVEIDSENFSIQLTEGESPTEKKILIQPASTAVGTTGKVMANVIINGKIEKNYYFYALVR